MYSEFAYSGQMQFILGIVTFTETFCSMYLLSEIILVAFGLSAERKQRMFFAFITGTLLQNVFTYGVYFLGGKVSFSFTLLLLIVTPNPINGLIYYFTAQKVFKLSPVRSVKIVSYVYLFWMAAKILNRLNGAIFFVQNEARYNYLKDACQQIVYFIIFFAICHIVKGILKKNRFSLKFVDNTFANKNREIMIFFLNASFAYAIRIILPLVMTEQDLAYALSLVILVLFIVVNVCADIVKYNKQTISNHEVHISALFKGAEELRGIKHDFNNILHTYSGFLELKEYDRLERYHAKLVSDTSHAGTIMELGQKMAENPAVIKLLINKLEYAENMNVKLVLSLKCELDNLYVDNMDASRILACLLDNAIEAACDSEQRKVHFTVESKDSGSKLIIITNSTLIPIDVSSVIKDGMTDKAGHSGIGLSVVRNILEQYGNCSFQMKYYDYEVSTYIELKDIV